jgi:hypothetical protein
MFFLIFYFSQTISVYCEAYKKVIRSPITLGSSAEAVFQTPQTPRNPDTQNPETQNPETQNSQTSQILEIG